MSAAERRPPPTDAQVYVLANALLSAVELRFSTADTGTIVLQPGLLANINVDDGSVDIQYEGGLMRRIKRRTWTTRNARITWQWPDAPDPTDPDAFVPTHAPKGSK